MTTALQTTPEQSATPAPAAGNTVLSDLLNAIETYPQTYLTVEIYEVKTDGTAINAGDDVTFKVHVHNAGPLNVKNLTLLVEAEQGATGVKLHGSTVYKPSLTSAVIAQVPAHQADGVFQETVEDHFHLQAGSASGDQKVDLVKVSINDWDTDFDHITIAHSDPAPDANDIYSHKIAPS